MTWIRLDDGFCDHPKVVEAGNEATGVYVRMLSYCGKHLTDGRVPDAAARNIGRPAVLNRLSQVGLIERNGAAWVIPDFLEFNPSRKQVERDREEARQRMRTLRSRR